MTFRSAQLKRATRATRATRAIRTLKRAYRTFAKKKLAIRMKTKERIPNPDKMT